MKNTAGYSISAAARNLHAEGIPTGAGRLRSYLRSIGAVHKTGYGYEAAPAWRKAGLLRTISRMHTFETDTGYVPRHYTVVVITADGMAWLREALRDQQRTA